MSGTLDATPSLKPKKYDKYCYHGTCKNKSSECAAKGITFIPFPKPTTVQGAHNAQRWIAACRRQSLTLLTINKNTYVCSQHFVDPSGPTATNPDPIDATCEIVPCRNICKRNFPDCSSNNQQQIKVMKVVVNENNTELSKTQLCNVHNIATQTQLTGAGMHSPTQMDGNSYCISTVMCSVFQEVMTRCKDWVMKCEIESDTFRTSLMKLVRSEVKMMVVARFIDNQYNISVFIGQYQLQQSHPFWLTHTLSGNQQELIAVLNDLSNWNVCVKLESTAPNAKNQDRSVTSPCRLLCVPQMRPLN